MVTFFLSSLDIIQDFMVLGGDGETTCLLFGCTIALEARILGLDGSALRYT